MTATARAPRCTSCDRFGYSPPATHRAKTFLDDPDWQAVCARCADNVDLHGWGAVERLPAQRAAERGAS